MRWTFGALVAEILVWVLSVYEIQSNHCDRLVDRIGAPPDSVVFWCGGYLGVTLPIMELMGPLLIAGTVLYIIISWIRRRFQISN